MGRVGGWVGGWVGGGTYVAGMASELRHVVDEVSGGHSGRR